MAGRRNLTRTFHACSGPVVIALRNSRLETSARCAAADQTSLIRIKLCARAVGDFADLPVTP
jgi:hypothetical protein